MGWFGGKKKEKEALEKIEEIPWVDVECAICGTILTKDDCKVKMLEEKTKRFDGYICEECLFKSAYGRGGNVDTEWEFSVEAYKKLIFSEQQLAILDAIEPTTVLFDATRLCFKFDSVSKMWGLSAYVSTMRHDFRLADTFDSVVNCWVETTRTQTVVAQNSNALQRGAVGSLLGGDTGAILGAASAKTVTTVEEKEVATLHIQLTENRDYAIPQMKPEQAQQVRDALLSFRTMETIASPSIAAVQAAESENQSEDPTDTLRKYKALLDDGIITEEEFNAKKKQLLGL